MSSYDDVCKKNRNKNMHILNGKISKNGSHFLLTWNKGNSSYSNKRDDISITLERHRPDFFTIHEANYNVLKDKGFSGYNLKYNTLYINSVISRTMLLVKKGINFKRRYDLDNSIIPSIWLQVYISKKNIYSCLFLLSSVEPPTLFEYRKF